MKIKTIIPIAIITVAFILLYHEVIAQVYRSWSTAANSHGPLILGVSLYLIWINRKKLSNLRPEPSILPGALLLAAGCFTLIAGKLGGTMMVQIISVVPVILGIILLLAGFSWFKVFLLPVSYLIFLTGFIERLLGDVAIYLQQTTAWISAQLFKFIGFSVFHESTLIMLPHISLEVAYECSGISHIVSLLALAVPLAIITLKSTPRKIILVLSALFIGIFANGLRVFLIGAYTLYYPGVEIHGPSETLYVSSVFFFGLVLLVIFSRFLREKAENKESTGKSRIYHDEPSPYWFKNKNKFASKRLVSFFVVGSIFVLAFGLVNFYVPKPVDLLRPLDLFPARIAGFTAKDLDQFHERLRPFPADRELIRLYENDQGRSIELYIGYLEKQDANRKVVDVHRSWMHHQAQRVSVQADHQAFAINRTSLREGAFNADIYFWYQLDGRIIRNEYAGKLFTFMDALLKRRNNGAVIVIKTSIAQNEVVGFLEDAIPKIQTYLSVN